MTQSGKHSLDRQLVMQPERPGDVIYANPENWEHPISAQAPEFLAMSAEARAELAKQEEELFTEIVESGELVGGAPLADPLNTRTVRIRGGVPAITDGPFSEAKEQLAGYFEVDCETPERAMEIAMRMPDARFGTLEVRPIMGSSGQEA